MGFENLYSNIDNLLVRENSACDLLTDKELDLIKNMNNTGYNLKFKPLSKVLDEIVMNKGNNIAITTENRSYTYCDFHMLIKKFCSYIKGDRVTFPKKVAIMLEKGIGQAVSVVGTVYGGASYIPIEYESPVERIEFCYESVSPEILITDEQTKERLKGSNIIHSTNIITYKEIVKSSIELDFEPVQAKKSDEFAIIFTSGSSGKPKGVVISNGSIYNCLMFFIDYHSLSEKDKILSVSNICHDMSIFELFVPLMIGGTVVMPDADKSKDGVHWKDLVIKHKVTFWSSVPTIYSILLSSFEECKSKVKKNDVHLKNVMLAGEVIPSNIYRRTKNLSTDISVFGSGGPTETTLLNVIHPITKEDADSGHIPYGVPIWNTSYLVLDEDLQIAPIGEVGVIYNGGTCLANGYVDQKLTEQKFIYHPELKVRLYNTGDLGKYNENGWVDILGRADNQVKINGKRIELEEIEKAIEQNGYVRKSMVSVYENEIRGKCLVAQVLFENKSYNEESNVNHWKTVFDETYNEERSMNEVNSDFSGWHSTYTGNQIPNNHMEEWTNSTVDSITKICGKRVLEIGCGTGLLLYRIAKNTDKYVGVDLSDEAIEFLKYNIKDNKEYANVEVYQASADNLKCVKGRKFDTIIINSVIMFFPSGEYLLKVIKECMDLLVDGGNIFLGDIQDYDLVDTFRSSVALYKSNNESVGELKKIIREDCSNLKDLYVSQKFFNCLQSYVPEITGVAILQKNMTSINEISKFRYDVVINKNKMNLNKKAIEICFSGLSNLERHLDTTPISSGNILILKDINNAMTLYDCKMENKIKSSPNEIKVKELKQSSENQLGNSYYPYEFYSLADKYGYYCTVKRSKSSMMSTFDVYLSCEAIENNIEVDEANDFYEYTNEIVENDFSEEAFLKIRNSLQAVLPKYMIPVIWEKVSDFPRMRNGKFDRRESIKRINNLLKERDQSINETTMANTLEEEIINIWSRYLNLREVDKEDHFFEIGGHSLLAMRMLSEINMKYQVDIRFSEFHKNPTISAIEEIVCSSEVAIEMDERDLFEVKLEDRHKEFPMTGLQYSYIVGRQPNIPLGNCATHLYLELEVMNPNIKKIDQVLSYLINKHDVFRMEFTTEGNQIIRRDLCLKSIEVDDFSHMTQEMRKEAFNEKRKLISETILDYTKAPLARFSITKVDSSKHYLHIYLDGLIIDGWSCQAFLTEFDKLYTGNCGNPKPELSFRDYVMYLDMVKNTTKYEKAKKFWLEKIKSYSQRPQLPLLKDPSEVKSISNIKISRSFTKDMLKRLKEKAKGYKVSAFDVMLTAFAQTISMYSKKQSFLINIPYTYRPNIAKNIEYMLGECANFFIYNYERKQNETMLENMLKIHEDIIILQDNIDYPGEEIIRERMKNSNSFAEQVSPVVFTSLLGVPYEQLTSFKQTYIDTHTSQIWIDGVVFHGNDGGCIFSWDCVKGLFDENLLNKMFDTYLELINNFIYKEKSWESLNHPDLVATDQMILGKVKSDFDIPVSRLKNITELAVEMFEEHSELIAIESMDEQYTYSQVKEMIGNVSNQVKQYVKIKNDRIAIIAGKSVNQIVAILSIVMNGGCYVPIELSYPVETMIAILENSGVKAILTDDENYFKAKYISERIQDINVINVDRIENKSVTEFEFCDDVNLNDEIAIIHSSGTTGQPKGMAIKHIGLSNCLMYLQEKFDINHTDVTIVNTNYCHDLSLFQIFQPLICGGTMAIPEERYWMDPQYIQQLMYKAGVTLWLSVPVMMDMVADANPTVDINKGMGKLRVVMLGGERMNLSTPPKVMKYAEDVKVFNVGGPAESTNLNIMHEVVAEDIEKCNIPYGRPISNTTYKILNDLHEECPIGVEGNMFIAGVGLVDGYIGLDELTKSKFIKNIHGFDVMYDTGDIGKVNEEGEIIFIGRNDGQVKLNGKRIEIDGIESTISAYEEIKSAIVKIGDHKQLMAYFVSDGEVDKNKLISYLEANLPKHEIPYLFKRIDSIPVTFNGKKDRSLLEDIEMKEESSEKQVIDDEVSRKIKEICCEILNIDDIDVNSNFVYMGGNSVHAIRVLTVIRRCFGVNIELFELLNEPIIKNWCSLVRKAIEGKDDINHDEQYNSLADVSKRKKQYSLSYSQEGILFKTLMSEETQKYIVGVTEIDGKIDVEAIKYAFREVINNNDILSCRIIETDDGDFMQEDIKNDKDVLAIIESKEIDNDMISQLVSEMSDKKTNLWSDKLYDFKLVHSFNKSILIMGMHHIISDDETYAIVMDDIVRYYASYRQKHQENFIKKLQYQDYINWLKNVYEKTVKKKDMQYWDKSLEELRDQYPNSNILNCTDIGLSDKNFDIHITKKQVQLIKQICVDNNVTLYNCLTMLYALTVMNIFEEENVWIGMPISNRRNMVEANVCGVFVNAVPLLVSKNIEDSYLTMLTRIFRETMEIAKHATLPFDYIVRKLGLNHEYAKLPYNILINYLGATNKKRKVDDLVFGEVRFEKDEVSHNLGLLIEETDSGECRLSLSGNSELFADDILCIFIETFKEILSDFISNPSKKI